MPRQRHYHGENHLRSLTRRPRIHSKLRNVCATRDAFGQRVQDYQSAGSSDSLKLSYPRDIFGYRTGIWDDHSSVNWVGWDVYWSHVAGQRLNMGGASAYIDHADAVGTTLMETDPSGGVDWDITRYPWGEPWQQSGTRGSAVFAGLDWQVNDPLLPSATRELSPVLGRWMTPDPMGSDITNPQSLNRYAYVLNNPTTLIDPLGLDGCDQSDDPEHCRALCWSEGDDYPNCPNETGGGGGYPVGGRGSSGGGGGAPAPPSVPPAGQPPLPGSEGFVGLPPCIDYNSLIPPIVAGLNAALHPTTEISVQYKNTQGGAGQFIVNGGKTITLSQPLKGHAAWYDIFHDSGKQVIFRDPKVIVPGAGNVYHVLYDPIVKTSAGATQIQINNVHFDIISARNPLHVGSDLIFAPIVSAIEHCGKGGIKFQ